MLIILGYYICWSFIIVKIWNSPEMITLSVEHTYADRKPNGNHDGTIYNDLLALWPDGIEGHSKNSKK